MTQKKEVLYVVAEELGLSRMQFEQMLAMEIAARPTLPKVDSIANTNKVVINSKVATNTNNRADTNKRVHSSAGISRASSNATARPCPGSLGPPW